MPPLRKRIGLAVVGFLVIAAAVDGARSPEDQCGVVAHGWAIAAYRAGLKPLIEGGTTCRFEITCSEYLLRVVRQHGWPKGLWLTAQRLSECR